MAHLDLSHVDESLRRLLGIRLRHSQYMLVAAAVASLTILGVAAAMMAQI